MLHPLLPRCWHRTAMRLTAVLLVLIFMAALVRSPQAAGAEGASEFVRDFGGRAVAMLADPALGPKDRQAAFRRLLTNGFQLDAIGRFVLGRHWRRASEDQRRAFRKLFEDYIVASYADRLSSYAGGRLVIEGDRAKGARGVLVKSRITSPQGEPVRVEWRLHRKGQAWKIIDVVVEGVSMAVTQRSEFNAVIAGAGGEIDGLLDVLRAKTAQQAVQVVNDTQVP